MPVSELIQNYANLLGPGLAGVAVTNIVLNGVLNPGLSITERAIAVGINLVTAPIGYFVSIVSHKDQWFQASPFEITTGTAISGALYSGLMTFVQPSTLANNVGTGTVSTAVGYIGLQQKGFKIVSPPA